LAHDIHDAAQPAKVGLLLLRLADAPGEFSNADDVNPGGGHQLRIPLPGCLRIVCSSAVGVNPLLRMVIDAEIHNVFVVLDAADSRLYKPSACPATGKINQLISKPW